MTKDEVLDNFFLKSIKRFIDNSTTGGIVLFSSAAVAIVLANSPLSEWYFNLWHVKFPLCVIEILSPTQSLNELTTKAKGYFQHGVQSCWIVLPTMSNIYVYSSPSEYDIFRATETLVDSKLNISFPLVEVFK